jgi:glutamine synthetase
MNLQTLSTRIEQGEIDTVLAVFPDLFGRLLGKRFTGKFFLDHVAREGTHCCNYLLAINIEMDPLDGFKVANWEKGFGDFALRPDLSTIRVLPWQPGAAMVICDFLRENGEPVRETPRSVLRTQVERLIKEKQTACVASELEFFLYNQSFHQAFEGGYNLLKPSSDYRIDYHTMQPSADEPLFRLVRNWMGEARVPVEGSKGEWGRGQHEVNFVCNEPLVMADMHAIFKQGVKEIASQQGKCVTFMPKPLAQEVGSSCHLHVSLWRGKKNLFWDGKNGGGSKLFRQFLGGLMKYSPELCYFFAPTINSYKRYQPGSWAPTKMAWSHDNRTVGFRVVGHDHSFRIENRMPGADANPYLAFAATLAAGLAGIEEELDCGDDYRGNAYVDQTLPSLPQSLAEAAALLEQSALAKQAFGQEVLEYYLHSARLEVQAFDNAVTDWERMRYFERM